MGRRAGLREFGAPAERRHREFTVEPLKRGSTKCQPIKGQLTHWRTDGKTVVSYSCGDRSWVIQFDYHDEIEDAVATAKLVARHWRSLMQSGGKIPKDPSRALPSGVTTQPLGSNGLFSRH